MKKLICILLIISIITCIFADNVIFEQKEDSVKKELSERELNQKSYYKGYNDGIILAKEDKGWIAVGAVAGAGIFVVQYISLYWEQEKATYFRRAGMCLSVALAILPFISSYKPKDTEYLEKKNKYYVKGFLKGYSKKTKELNYKNMFIGFFSVTLIMSIFILWALFSLFRDWG